MAEELPVSSGAIEVKLSVKVGEEERQSSRNDNSELPTNERNKEDEEEPASDEEFIRVEKEISADEEEISDLLNSMVEAEKRSDGGNRESGDPEANDNFGKLKDRIKELELQIQTVLGELRSSEAEKALLKSEFNQANEELEEIDKHCQELENDQKLMKSQIVEAELRHNLQVESLKEAQKASDAKDQELNDARESFIQLSTELGGSRERIKALEEELSSSVSGLHKLEELNKQCTSEVESLSSKVLDLEKALELAHVNEKEMEDQISDLRKELKELHGEIAEKNMVEEVLQSTSSKLSRSNEYLGISISQVAELEQKLASKDAFIYKLTEELNLHKFSHDQLQEEVAKLENMLSPSKEDSNAKLVEELELKLQEQIKEREAVEVHFKNQEVDVASLRRDLSDSNEEKMMLESTVRDLRTKLLESEELNSQLEAKINLADQEFEKTNSLLSLALLSKEEMEKKMESLELLHHESRTSAEAARSRTLELEGLLQASITAEESNRTQAKESEMKLALMEKRNMELEQQLNLAGLKCLDAENEIKGLNQKITELNSSLNEFDEENTLLRQRFKNYEDRIYQLESSLSNSSSRNSELEKEINDLLKTCVEHEEQAAATHYRTLELEDLIHSSRSKAEVAEKRAKELELLVEAANSRTQELEQLLSVTEQKRIDAGYKLEQYNRKVSQLTTELESCQEQSTALEALLQAANETERNLTDILNAVTVEKQIFEDLSKNQETELHEFKNQIRTLENELKYLRDKTKSSQEELEASSVREKALLEKLRYSGEQMEHQKKALEETAARNLELTSLHESLVKDSELKVEEAVTSFKQKESEAKQLFEKINSLEEQLEFYKQQSLEATENATLFKAELRENSMKQESLENDVEELKQRVLEANQRVEGTLAENQLLVASNSKLKDELEAHQQKVDEHNELLKSIQDEKEAIAKENETQLSEAIEKHKQRDSEARQLQEELLALQTQLRNYEEQAGESAVVAVTQNTKLEEAHLKLQDLECFVEQTKHESVQLKSENEGLARQNLSLSEKFAVSEIKRNELKVAFDSAITEKEDLFMQIHSSKKEMEDRMQLLNADKERLQSQLFSLMEERNLHNEAYQKEKHELEAIIAATEGSLIEHKERELSLSYLVENLKADVSEKSLLQRQISELEKQLEHQTKAVDEVTARNSELNSVNENLVKDSELKLQESVESLKQKEVEACKLLEKFKSLEEQLTFYKDQANKATEDVTSLQQELALNALKHSSLENTIQELEQKLLEANLRGEWTLAENEELTASNTKFKDDLEAHRSKVNELHELLQTIHSEKQDTAEQLASHASTIETLTMECSRGLDLQSATESRLREKEAQLYEAIEQHKQRDFEARLLHEKLLALETQLRIKERQASDSAVVAATHKDKMEEALLEINDLKEVVSKLENILDQFKSENEVLARHNVSLSEEIATYETKMNELQVAFDAVVTEKDDVYMKLHHSKQELEGHIKLLDSEKGKLQSQINTITEEKNTLNEIYLKEKNEHERTIGKLEENLREQLGMKASLDSLVESLKAELSKKSLVQAEMEEQLELQSKVAEEITARHLDLNSLNESLVKDSEVKLQEAAARFNQKEIEAKELLEKVKLLEEQLTYYKQQAAEANEKVSSLKVELEMNVVKLGSLEDNVADLKQQVSEANLRGEERIAENEFLAAINSKLKEELETRECNVSELNELLKSIHSEKEATIEQLTSHASTIEKLTAEHSRSLEVRSATEFRLKENEVQLHESIERLKLRDLESRELNEKLLALENQMKVFEKQASESASVAANKNDELEEAVFRIQELEVLVEQLKTESGQLKTENDHLSRHNLSLLEKLAANEAKMNNLQEAFEAAVTEKENLSMQSNCSKKEMEDLMQLLNSDKDKLQSQIASIMEEKGILDEMCQNSRKELEETIAQLELKQNEQKERELSVNILLENLKAELSEKSVKQANLEQKLRFSEEQLEHLKKAMDDVSARNLELNSLNEYLVKDSELKLKEAAESSKEKESEAKELLEKLISLEEKLAFYEEEVLDATQNVTSLKAELEANAIELASHENYVKELKTMLSEANLRGEQSIAENQLLAKSNSKLNEDLEGHQRRINELNESLRSLFAEKEATVEQLASHASMITKLTDDHSRALELQSTTESRLKEKDAQLYEAIEKNKQRDKEATEMHEKLLMLEIQLRTHEQQASESAADAATHKGNLREAVCKIQDLEGLIGKLKSENESLTIHNLSLSDELAIYKTKINELQVAFDAVVSEKEDMSTHLYSSRKEMEDLIQLIKSDKDKLQLEVTTLVEEKIVLNEMYENAREELKTTKIESEEKLKEHEMKELSFISVMENLKEELSEKSTFKEELGQKLRHSEEQLENQRKAVADSTARNLELNSSIKDLELRLQEEAESFNKKELECSDLLKKLDSQQEQLRLYEEQAQEATEIANSLKADLAAEAMKVVHLENNVQELERNVSEADLRCEQALAENELLATSKSELVRELEARQDKVNHLNDSLKSIHDEKEAAIEKLTLEYSRALELHSVTDSRLKENQAQLHEAIQKYKQRDLEATELHQKLLKLETQLITYEKQTNEMADAAASEKGKLEEAMLKIQEMEALAKQFKIENESLTRHNNMTLSEELLTYETKIKELQTAFDAVAKEKEEISMKLFYSKKEMEDLIQLLKSDKDKLESQVTLIMEENIMLNERCRNARQELEATTVQLEEKLGEHKERGFSLECLVESLRAELTEKSLMHDELEQKLTEQIEHNRKLSLLNESLMKDLELKLNEATESFKQKESEARELLEQLNSLELQLTVYKEQTLEASEKVALLEAELAANAMEVVSLGNNVEELKQTVSVANLKGEQTLVENELLASLNSKLNVELGAHLQKVEELNELLKSIHAEKEATAEQATSHAHTIAKLTEEHRRDWELHCATKSLLKEKEAQLHEAIEKLKRRDLDAKELHEKLLALETQLSNSEKQVSESESIAATEKSKLEKAVSKIQNLEQIAEQLKEECHQFKNENEGIIKQSRSLSEDLATYEKKTNKLEEALEVAVKEKEDIFMLFCHSKKEMEDLIQGLKSEIDELQSKVALFKEENIMIDERNEKARKELKSTIVQLEEKLSEKTARESSLESLVENLQAELTEKSLMHEQLAQKLRYAEEQVEHYRKSIEEFTAKNLELELSNEALIKSSELKLLESVESFKQKESESMQLLVKLNSLEEQLTFYKEQALEATENVASLEAELAAKAVKVVSLENNVSDANLKYEKILAENELLATSNSRLKDELAAHQQKVNELNELLRSMYAEKETTVEQLTSHANTIAKLTEEHKRGLELHSSTQSLLKENEAHLHDALKKLNQRDLDATELNEKLIALESELRNFEKQASELAALAETEKGKFEEEALKVQDLEHIVEQLKTECHQLKKENEGLTRHNLSVSEDLVAYEAKTNELQEALDVAVQEKEDISMKFCSSKKELEDIIQLLKSEKDELRNQVTLVSEENTMINERYKKARAEIESITVQLEEKLSEQKAREFSLDSLVESLRAELVQKSLMHEEVAENLTYAEEQVEHHKNSISEFTARNLELNSLFKDSELKLKEAAENLKKKESEYTQMIEKVNSLEEQSMFYREQALEASKNVASLEAELAAKAIKMVSLEDTVEELKQQISGANLKTEQTLAENELLATSNSNLKGELEAYSHKLNELNDMLNFTLAEKEDNFKQLMSHETTIANLTEEQSRGLELHSRTAYLLKDNEVQLQEAIEKLSQKDLEAGELNEKLLALEAHLLASEKLASEYAAVVSTEKEKMEEAVSKIQNLEGLLEQLKAESHQFKTENEGLITHNLSLSKELETCETKINQLQVAFNAAVTEKEDISMQFYFSKKGMEDLIQLLKSDKEELQSQVSMVSEKNIMLNERYEKSRKELESTIFQLEEKLGEQATVEFSLASLVESLQAELSEKSLTLEELVQKLRYADEQVEHHGNSVAELTARNLELSSFNESLVKNSELKLQEAAESFRQKESEAIRLLEKLTSLEEQLTCYREQALKATENVASLEAQVAANAVKVVSLESNIEELRKQVSEANLKGEQTFAEKELLATSNSKLEDELDSFHHKVDELNELLKAVHAEKEAVVEQFASHADTIVKLTEEHSRGMELCSATESSLKQSEAELQKAFEELKKKDLEVRELNKRLLAFETQLRIYKEQASESAVIAETQSGKLEEAVSKILDLEELVDQLKAKCDQAKKENEGLTREILILSEELATYNTKIIKLQLALDTAVTDKENVSLQFHSSVKEMDDLVHLLKSDKESLKSEVASVMEENIMLNNMYQKSRNELEATQAQWEAKLSEQKTRELSLNSVVEGLREELSEKSIFQEELAQNLRGAEEQLEHLRKSLEEVNAENLKLNSLSESLANVSELKLQEAAENLKKKEHKENELFEKLKFLEEQLTFYKEKATKASEHAILLEAELEENTTKLVSVEDAVKELKQKNVEINLRSEKSIAECEILAASNSKLEEELVAHQHKINELNDFLKSIHDEKEAAVEKLSSHTIAMANLTDQQSRDLELHFETQSRLKENEAKLHEAIEKHSQKDLEIREFQEKLHSLETKLIMYEELASESALVAATRKGKLEEAVFRIQDLEGLVQQLQSMLDQLKTENKDLERHNHSLTEELMTHETKLNELRVAFDEAITDKEDISMRLHSSNREMEDILRLLNSDNQKLHSQITFAMEEKIMVDEIFEKARKELEETIVQLEEKLSKQKAREFSLNSLVENLKAELSEKSLMQAQILELEKKMLLAEETYAKEIESMVSAIAEKDEILTAKVLENTILNQERDALDNRLKEILKEFDSAKRTMMEQKKLESMELKRQASMEQSRDAFESQNQRVGLLEKQVEELKKKLLEAKTQYKEKVIKEAKKIRLLTAELNELKLQVSKATEMEMKIIKLENALQLAYAKKAQELKNETSHAEMKVEMELKSGELQLDTLTFAERKVKNKSNRVHLDTEPIDERQIVNDDIEPSVAMAFKFLLGVAVVSMVLGLILGKRY